MDDRQAERDQIDRAIRHLEARLHKPIQRAVDTRDLALLDALHRHLNHLRSRDPRDFSS